MDCIIVNFVLLYCCYSFDSLPLSMRIGGSSSSLDSLPPLTAAAAAAATVVGSNNICGALRFWWCLL